MWIVLQLAAVLSLAQTAVITTIAGTERGYGGDGGPAYAASFSLASIPNPCDPGRFEQISHLSIDTDGNLYLADSNNHRIRRIGVNGIVESVAGSGSRPSVNLRCEAITGIGDNGPAGDARLFTPAAAALHPNGNLILTDQMNNRIRQVTPAGQISTLAGSGLHNLYAPGIPATASPMDWPTALEFDANGSAHFSEIHSNRIGRIDANGRLATVAGIGFPGFAGDGGRAVAAQLRRPTGIAFDSSGNLYIADSGNHRIRRVNSEGIISTVAGNGRAEFRGDEGLATEAALNNPMDIAIDHEGNLYIADTLNHRIRRVDTSGIITTIAGTGEPGRGDELIPALESALDHPSSLVLDTAGDLYFTDWQNHRLRKIVFAGRPVIAPPAEAFTPSSSATFSGIQFLSSEEPTEEERAAVIIEIDKEPVRIEALSLQTFTVTLPSELTPGLHTIRIQTPAGYSTTIAFRVAEP